MRKSRVLLIIGLAAGIGLWGVMQAASQRSSPNAWRQTGTLLNGTTRSASGQALEGVTVSARAEGTTITTSVFTDENGFYIFPPLEKGRYRVWAQAEGFATGRAQATLDGPAAARQDFVLTTIKDVAPQLTGAEWIASLPEETLQDHRIKDVFLTNCTSCHQPNFVLQNRFDKAGWEKIIDLMSMVNVTGNYSGLASAPLPIIQYHKTELAAYLAKVRGPEPFSKWKLFPRPKGDAALAVITEYNIDLADNPGEYPLQDGSDWSEGVPSSFNGVRGTHDCEIDFNGNIWVVTSFPNPNRTYAKIDAQTGKVTSYKITDEKGVIRMSHGVRKDENGILWFNLSGTTGDGVEGGSGSLARLDPITGKLDVYTPPKGMSGVGGSFDVDGKGKIWASTREGAIRFDPETGKFQEFKSLHYANEEGTGNTYGVAADSEGNGYWAQMSIDMVGKSDIATGKSLEIRMPPRAEKKEIVTGEERKLYALSGSDWNSAVPWAEGPRRLSGDHKGNAVWVADWWGDNLAKIDIHTLKVTPYSIPKKGAGVYAVVVDKNHVVWVNMMNNDSVAKFDPATGKWTEYMLPTHGAETRHIALSDRQYPPVVVVPYWRSNKVARLQFRTKDDVQALKEQLQTKSLHAENR
jgi:streptogramin lyase